MLYMLYNTKQFIFQDGNSPLHSAVAGRDIETTMLLLKRTDIFPDQIDKVWNVFLTLIVNLYHITEKSHIKQ